MKITNRELINYLEIKNDWCEASAIADVFGVSTKTVANYIRRINDFADNSILSSHKGYKINTEVEIDKSSLFFNDDFTGRVNYIMRKIIIGGRRVTTYDLADSLYISDSHLEVLLKHIKRIVERYNLNIYRKRNIVEIRGSELDKRRLISTLIQKENIDFIENNTSFFHDKVTNYSDLSEKLIRIFADHDIFINDYQYNTIIIYIVIMAERIINSHNIESENTIENKIKMNPFLNEVKTLVENYYSISISENEFYYLALTVNNYTNFINTDEITMNNICNYVSSDVIKKTISAIIKLENNYHLEQFDDLFRIKMILHTAMLFDRVQNGELSNNPLTSNIKNSYPFIYDMATFFVKEIFENQYQEISDVEISFIAIHIGAFLEYNSLYADKLNCCFVFINYHNYYEKTLNLIKEKYNDKINIISIINIRNKKSIPNNLDFIITNYPLLKVKNTPVVVVDDFLNDESKLKLSSLVEEISSNKKKMEFRKCLEDFSSPELFMKNQNENDSFLIIKTMVNNAINNGYCEESFLDEVLEREQISSTSFESGVAIPHSLYQKCSHSFLSVSIFDEPIMWDDHNVNIVLIVGVNNENEYRFKLLLDNIIPLLSQKSNVLKLLSANTYRDFIECLFNLV